MSALRVSGRVAAAVLLSASALLRASGQPLADQVHLSLSGLAGEMVIDFVTYSAAPACAFFAADPSSLIAPSTPEPPAPAPGLPGWLAAPGYLIDGYDLAAGNYTTAAAAAWCAGNSSCAGFTFADGDATCGGHACYVYFKTGLQYAPAAGWSTVYKPPAPLPNVSATTLEYRNATLGPIGWLHTAVIRGLAAGRMYYVVGGCDGSDWSQLRWFDAAPTRQRFGVLADFGLVNDESVGALYADAQTGAFDYVLLAGDQAYDFDSNNGETGNVFMRMLEGVAAHFPLMVAPGNHEAHHNYSQYSARYAGTAMNAGHNSGSDSAIFYSLDIGLVHFIFFSTEVYWSQADVVARQAAWMAADLAKANANRAAVPWLVAIAHKAWSMDTTWCPPGGGPCTANGTWFDEPLQAAGVEFMFVGHQHEYRRYSPAYGTRGLLDVASMSGPSYSVVTDPRYMETIVTGAPGCPEVQPASCGGPSPTDPSNPTAACSRNYGYGYLEIINATHATWLWQTKVPHAGSPDPAFQDAVTFVVHHHGPRA